MNGIDVSSWQGQIDWARARAAGAEAAYIRCGYGVAEDRRFRENWAAAKAVGIRRGAYLYYHQAVAAGEQLLNLLRVVNTDWGDLPPAVDVEQEGPVWTPRQNKDLQWVLWALERCCGRVPLIYTRASYWDTQLNVAEGMPDNSWASHYGLWVTHWNVAAPRLPRDWSSYAVWQYSADGNGAGSAYGAQSVDLDLNRWA